MELPENLKLIVFDFDGTLHDLAVDWQKAKELADVGPDESLGAAIEKHKKNGNSLPLEKLEQLEAEALADQILKPDVAEALKQLEQKYKLAVLSRNSSRPLSEFLERSGIKPEMVIGREEVSRFKPHPEGLQLIMQKLNVKAEEILMVGDTWHDIEVAKNAGVKSAIVGSNLNSSSSQPDFRLGSVAELIN